MTDDADSSRPSAPLRCDCDPVVYDDGSKTHEDTCNVAPWCPHEAGPYQCLLPCGCPCNSCKRLVEGYLAAQNDQEQTR